MIAKLALILGVDIPPEDVICVKFKFVVDIPPEDVMCPIIRLPLELTFPDTVRLPANVAFSELSAVKMLNH